MIKLYTAALLIFSSLAISAQDLNLSFETENNGLPENWLNAGNNNATITFDKQIKHDGEQSVLITSDSKEGFKGISLKLPNNYAGQKITLSGYIKTENVEGGYAGLWMRIDPEIGFDNMNKRPIKGTTDWKKYEITLKLKPEDTDKILLGAILSGTGKMWIDDLKITIDGKTIENAKTYERILSAAEKDNEFENGSKINSIQLSDANLKNLKDIGLLWGYLKYYHPKAHSGDINWDNEWFRIWPKIENKSGKERDTILLTWIENLGPFKTTTYKNKDAAKINPDLDWISNSGFSQNLVQKLNEIKTAERSNENYYVKLADKVGNPLFTHEKPYKIMDYSDAGLRLLTLFRYWNMMQYYFPYKNLIEEDWKNVLVEFIPKILKADNEEKYTLTTLELIAKIHDTHANISAGSNSTLANYYGNRYAPLEVTFVGNQAVVKDYFDKNLGAQSGVEIGDVITHINGTTTEDYIKGQLPITPASNYPTQLRNIAYRILRSNNDVIPVKIKRDGKELAVDIKTYPPKELKQENKHEGSFFKTLKPGVAYFYMGTVKGDEIKSVMKNIKDTKGLVIDFRSYPSDFVVFKLGELLKSKSTDFVKFTNGSVQQPGLFTFTKSLSVGGSSDAYQGKIAILINETTQSSAEYHTMAFRTAPNAKVFGSTTAAADGNVSEIILPGNIKTMISGIGVYYPDGKETQRVGIVPDIEVKPTVEGIKTKKDEVLEKAVEWINS